MNTSSTEQPHIVVAVPPGARPEIKCPPWCVIPYDEHLADLPNGDGLVIHWSVDGPVRHSEETYPDGTPSDPPLIWLREDANGIEVGHAERLARSVLAAVEEARS